MMNELIEHLAERTVMEMDQDEFHEDMNIPDAYLEKFAELIVRECAMLCDQAVEENKRTFYTVNETRELGPTLVAKGAQVQAEKLSKQIKEHFGVE